MLGIGRAIRVLLGASVGIVGAMALAANRGGNSQPPALDAPPARSTERPPAPKKDLSVRFQFDGVPYTDVVRQFAQAAGKPLIGDLNIDGTLTFFDSQPYDYDEAFDTLNLILGMKGFALREEGRFLRLRPLGEVVSSTRVLKGLEEADEKDVRPGEIVTVMIPLQFMEPDTAAKAIVRMVSSFGSVSPLAQGKGIIITDRLSNIRRVKGLLESLDTGTLVDRQLKTYTLTNAQASVAAEILKQLFGPTAAQKWVYDPEHNRLKPSPPDPRDIVTVSHDNRANMVVLVGTGDKLAMAEQMLQRLDKTQAATGDIRIFKLDKSRADQVAETLRQLVPKLQKKGSQTEASIVPDIASNRLLVAAPPEQMKRIEKVIRDLDTASEEKASVRIFELDHADPRQLVGAILNATGQRDLYGRVTHTLTASALPDGRRLVVSGPSRDLQAAEELIRQLDTAPEDVQREVHVVQLDSGDVGQVASTLQQLFSRQRGRRQADDTDPVVIPEYSSNSLFISVLPKDWPEVQKLLAKVQDSALKQAVSVVKVYNLKHTKAPQLASTLQQAVRYRHYNRRGKMPILIVPSERNNSLLITATEADQTELAGMIDMLDVPGAAKIDPVTMIRLQAARADELANKLRSMLPEARGWNAAVHIQADPATNSVLLRAPAEQRDMIEKIIAQLDQATQAEARETRIVRLQHVAGGAMVSMLQRLYPHRRGMTEQQRVTLTPGPHDQSVIIEAPKTQLAEIQDMTASLDIRGGEDTFEVRTYDFEAGNVHEIARSLQRLFAQRWNRQLRSNVSSQPAPRFEVHSAGNQLLVAATPEQFKEIEAIIGELKVQTQLSTATKTYRLSHARADELAPVLTRMLQPDRRRRSTEPPARVMALPSAEALVIKASPRQLALAAQLIASFDTPDAAGRDTLQVVKLKNAQAEPLVRSLAQALRRRGRGAPAVNVTAETNSNSVLLRGPAEELDDVIAKIRELDADSVSEDVQVRIYPLEHSDARQLAQTFQAIFRDILNQQMWTRGRSKQAVPFSVAANERTNSLVVSTTPAYFATVEQMLANLDSQDKAAREVEYVYLDNADALEVARQLEDMFRDRRWSDRPVIQADPDSNTLSLIGSDADLTMMQRVVTKLDGAAADRALRVRVVPLMGVPAKDMAAMVQRIYSQMSGAKVVVTDQLPRVAPQPQPIPAPAVLPESRTSNAAPPSGEDLAATSAPASAPAVEPSAPSLAVDDKPRITIAVDTRANALLLSGPKRELEEVQRLITELTFSSAAEAEFRTFALQRAEPAEVAQTLDELFNPKTPRVVRGRTLPPEPVITVIPEPRSRSVIVRAEPMEFEVIEPLIRQMDRVSTTVSEVRIFALKNADALAVAQNLRGLFSASPDAGSKRSPQARRREMVNRMLKLRSADGSTTAVEIAADISVQANRSANSLVVSAPADAMDLIARLVEELDQSGAETSQPVVRMYPLKQAEVAPTVTALQQLYPPNARRRQTAPPQVPVIVTGDEQARLLIVSASPEDQQVIASIVKDIERSQSSRELYVRVYPLENTDAPQVANALNETLTRRRNRRGRRQDTVGLRITAEPSNNSIVALADEATHKQIEKLIERLDASKLARQPVQMIPLQHADPQKLATTLNRLFQTGNRRGRRQRGGGARVLIQADTDARALVVQADENTFAKIEALARRLDADSTAGAVSQTLIALQHAESASVAAALQQAFRPRRGQRLAAEDLVTVVSEPASNSLIVTANPGNLQKVQALVSRLDDEKLGGTRNELLLLQNAKARELAGVLSRIAGATQTSRRGRGNPPGGVTVAAEETSNALVMTGPGPKVAKLMQMARQLDQAADAGTTGVYVIPLESGEAEQTAAMIRDLHRQQLQLARRGGRTPEPLAVTADSRANALVLAAGPDMAKQVEQWVKQVESMKPARGQVKIIPLQHAEPNDVKRAIDQMLNGGSSGNRRRGGGDSRVEVTVLPRQRAVMVSAPADLDEQIARLIATLEEAAEKSRRKTQIFTLQNAPNQRVVQALQQVYRQQGRVPEDERISITALPDSNAVLVAAPKEKLAEIEHLIRQLDLKDIAPQLAVRIFRLQNAQPEKILPTLRQMLRQLQRVNPGQTLGVQADQRTRSIIVTAPDEVFEQVQSLIDLLDQAPAFAEADVLVIPLKRADAARLAAVLSDMLRPSPNQQITPEARALQEQIRRLRVRSTARDDIPPLDLTQPIKITADPARPAGSNSLILSSTAENLKALAAIVEVLDSVPVAPGVAVKLIHLKNADAQSVEDILRKVFAQGKRLAGTPGTPAQGRAEPETTAGKALVRELNVSADPRTNSLILAGEEEVIALAELLVSDMDKQQGKIYTDIRLFRLKHADANRLAPLLQNVFAEARASDGAEGVQTHVTRLRTWLDEQQSGNGEPDQKPVTTDWPKSRRALSIRADAGTNILVVAARSDVMPLIADVVQSMDIPGAGSLNSVRIFPLTHADASRLQAVIGNLYRGPNAKLVRDEDKPTLAVDTRTNALIISASEKTFSMLATLIKQLDSKTPVELRELRLIPLENAEATALAGTLQKMMDARVQRQQSLGVKDAEALRTLITADARSNTLIVGGSAESFQIVQEIAERLDTSGPALAGRVQVFPIAEGNAGAIAQTLRNLFDQRYQAARTPDVRRQKPVILPDVRTNSLLVAATPDDTEILKGLLDRLDVKLTDPSVRLTVLPLQHNDAASVGQMLQQLFAARLRSMTPQGQPPNPQDRVDIATDSLSNALIVSASKENLDLIEGLLSKVDIEPPDETGIVRLYPLEHADAQRIATLLGGLLREGLYKPGLVGSSANKTVQAREKVSIAVDTRTNTLIVSASKENFAIVEEILRKLDTSEDYAGAGDIRVFLLKQANASNLAQMLQQFFRQKLAAERQTGASGRSLPAVIVADPRTNALLVAGSRESFADIEAMISRLDTDATTPAARFEIFALKKASASTVQRMLQQLFDQRATRGGQRQKITVIADRRSQSLIVGAPPEEMDTVRSLIARVDEQSPGRKPTEVFTLKHADAKAIQTTLLQLYRSQGGRDEDLSIAVDQRSNALVISGEKKDLQRVGELLAQLDRKNVKRVTEIKVFPLANADAEELAQILTSVLTEEPKAPGGVNTNRQTLLQFIGQTAQGEELITNALQEGVLITPDRRTNALVVSAPLENMPLLGNLIRSLDSTSPRSAQIKVFRLKNADATQMAAVLEQLFRSSDRVGTRRNNPAVTYQLATSRPAGNEAPPETPQATTGSAEQYALSITVDVRTNSLLVGGTKFQVEMAGAIIQELDSSPAQERLTKVYRPRHANPADIEKALRAFLDQERQRLQQVLGQNRLGAAQRLLEREVAVVAEPNSNTLLISASPRYFQTLATMIDELDRMPPQVLIQALLAEVLLDDETDLGIDWNYTTRRRDTNANFGDNFGVEATVTAGTPPIGFNVAITGGDLRFFLRALQAQNRLEVLSRPQILAADNQSARIQIGQRVPLITSSRVTDQGDTINTVTYEDVGVILDVLPRIGSDGQIQMEVKPELSSISGSFTPLSEFARAQYINNRSAKTTVNCYDGQTVIIGGLITTTDEDREEKIPVLGDIPLVGLLFRSTSKIKQRNELMVFLTPRVLRNAEDTLRVTREEIKHNHTIETLKRNHQYKRDIIHDMSPEDLREEFRRGSNRRPMSRREKRDRNIRKTITELELLPEHWTPPPPVEESDEAFEREVE